MTVGDDPAMRPVLAFDRANTILYCHRWKETVTFYRDALRLPVAHDTDWFVEFQLTASSYLSIADASRATIAAVEGQGVTSWRVADVSAARRRLIEQGLTPTDERTLWVQQSAMSATRRAIASSSGLPSDDDLGAHPRLALTFDAV